MAKTVVKFGGSSLSDANQFRKVAEIIKDDGKRRYVIPSAPGKRWGADVKVTDMLYNCYDAISAGADAQKEFKPIAERFDGIIADLGLSLSLRDEYETITADFANGAGADYAASRGEYLCGIVLAAFLKFPFIDAAKAVRFRAGGEFDPDLTNASLAALLENNRYAVIPGFYGSLPCGKIKTFSRGGSDFTGSIVAKAVKASLYENWTDVPGFLAADPRIVENPEIIRVITYRELRELSYMGATVLHEDAIFPVRNARIPINIRDTNEPCAPGTMIVPSAGEKDGGAVITGIAGKKNFSVISLEKDEMNNEIGFLRRILTLFEAEGVNFEHLPTGIDTLSIVLNTSELDKTPKLIERINEVARPNHIEVERGLAMIAVVGRAMKEKRGTATRIFAALSHARINIRMIDQGSSELNIIIGVKEEDFEEAVRVIYNMFMLGV
ncbi:MAG: aspartate kinase [Oscillospiraceae bacterium]|jgi:aspartate kinase|nr:aspartate kinase [Oscillospiraceae bacterium]